MSVYPGVIVDWCITAKVKGKGKPQRHQVMGDAQTATSQMAAWLEGLALSNGESDGDAPHVYVEADLTSEQLPKWVHTVTSSISGMPAEEAIEYTVDWLDTVRDMDNWGGGGGP